MKRIMNEDTLREARSRGQRRGALVGFADSLASPVGTPDAAGVYARAGYLAVARAPDEPWSEALGAAYLLLMPAGRVLWNLLYTGNFRLEFAATARIDSVLSTLLYYCLL